MDWITAIQKVEQTPDSEKIKGLEQMFLHYFEFVFNKNSSEFWNRVSKCLFQAGIQKHSFRLNSKNFIEMDVTESTIEVHIYANPSLKAGVLSVPRI